MAQITLNKADNLHRPPNTGDGTEFGDQWQTVVGNVQLNFTDLYGNSSGIATANRRGSVTQLFTNVAAFSSANTNTSQTMFSYSLPASTLAVAGSGIYIEAWGNVANNAAAKSMILNVGGQKVSTGTFTTAAVSWSLDAYYMLTAANAETFLGEGWAGTTRVASTTGTDTSTSTSAITVTVVGTDASAASANMLGNGLTVQFMP